MPVPVLPGSYGVTDYWISMCQNMLRQRGNLSFNYEAVTPSNAATEIFINGKANRRIYLPKEAGAIFGRVTVFAYNVTDGNAVSIFDNAVFAMERLANGTFQLCAGVDFDGAGGETNPAYVGGMTNGPRLIRFGAALTLAIAVAGSGAANDPYITVTVTGASGKVTRWLAKVEVFYRGSEDFQAIFHDQ